MDMYRRHMNQQSYNPTIWNEMLERLQLLGFDDLMTGQIVYLRTSR